MQRFKITSVVVFCWFIAAHAVTHLHLNNTSVYEIKSAPAQIVLACDAASAGNNLVCEIFIDINNNRSIDTIDKRIYYLNLVDGLGWIHDGDLTDNGIPGDETATDGFIRTTLKMDNSLRPYSAQTWLVRMTDADKSSASAILLWNVPLRRAAVSGQVLDKITKQPAPNALVFFRDASYPDIERFAIADSNGAFAIELTASDWAVYASDPVNRNYRQSAPQVVQVSEEKNRRFNVLVEKYATFVQGNVHFDNNAPAENITVALQNSATYEIIQLRTDENGHFKAGLEPGQYVVTTTEYMSRYLGNHYWPDGFYAKPAVDTLNIRAGQAAMEEITFYSYPTFVRGTCIAGGKPLRDVLVQAIAVNPATRKQQLYQTFSKEDGSFALGMFPANIKSLVAQKEGFLTSPLSGFKNINLCDSLSTPALTFEFAEQTGLMSLSGAVRNLAQQPLADVYVVAYNVWDHSPAGHLITQTDQNGRYNFDIKVEGDWQLGIHKPDFKAHPEMYYKYLSPGLKYENLDFTLSQENNTADIGKGQLMLSDFNILPHLPNPIVKETVIDFVLPKSSHTEVDVLSMDGEELITLVDHDLSSGFQKVRWNGTDETGHAIANGVYLCRIKAENQQTVLPITLLR